MANTLTFNERINATRMASEGLTTREIARALGVPPSSVQQHLQNIAQAGRRAERAAERPQQQFDRGVALSAEEWRNRAYRAQNEALTLRAQIESLKDELRVTVSRKQCDWLRRANAIPRSARGREVVVQVNDETDELRWILAVRYRGEVLEQRSLPMSAAESMPEILCNALLPVKTNDRRPVTE